MIGTRQSLKSAVLLCVVLLSLWQQGLHCLYIQGLSRKLETFIEEDTRNIVHRTMTPQSLQSKDLLVAALREHGSFQPILDPL